MPPKVSIDAKFTLFSDCRCISYIICVTDSFTAKKRKSSALDASKEEGKPLKKTNNTKAKSGEKKPDKRPDMRTRVDEYV